MDFEASTSFTYNFARYEILPALMALDVVRSGEPFLLREHAWPLIDERLICSHFLHQIQIFLTSFLSY